MNSKPLLTQLIEALSCLPGVGRKSAQRMAYHLLEKNRQGALNLGTILLEAMNSIHHCSSCRDYTERELCELCANHRRDKRQICVVESPSDIIAIESTHIYSGQYFVLMGHLSPLDGIGPDEIGLPMLSKRLSQSECEEIIIATSATVEGEATAHFIKNMVAQQASHVAVTRLAQGVPLGGELGYLDASTLSLSLTNRQSIK